MAFGDLVGLFQGKGKIISTNNDDNKNNFLLENP